MPTDDDARLINGFNQLHDKCSQWGFTLSTECQGANYNFVIRAKSAPTEVVVALASLSGVAGFINGYVTRLREYPEPSQKMDGIRIVIDRQYIDKYFAKIVGADGKSLMEGHIGESEQDALKKLEERFTYAMAVLNSSDTPGEEQGVK